MISELLKDAKLVLVFHGECPTTVICDGWAKLMERIQNEYTVNEDEHKELLVRLEDKDSWVYDDLSCTDNAGNILPWYYREETGEIRQHGYLSCHRRLDDTITEGGETS